jgi:predicted secreted acid phosphatase
MEPMGRFGTKKCRQRLRTICGGAVAFSLFVLLGPVVLACPCNEVKVPADPQANINRKTGLEFTRTSLYRREFSNAITAAKSACLANMTLANRAIVADIDETLLDNREEIQRHPDFTWDQFFQWMRESRAPVLKPTADLLSWARKNGFAIFLITGRSEGLRAATIENLVRQGVAYDGLYMRPEGNEEHAEAVKVPHREYIEKLGFKIVVNIGDQFSDLAGGHALDCEKLPNRMYFVQ